jgi:uncharacterized membrane protein
LRVTILSFVLLFFLLTSNFAGAASWSEVTQFTGSGDYISDYFTCNHAEWRIVWNYTPMSDYSEYARFTIDVLTRNETSLIGRISQEGNTTTNGTTYIHNQQGEFYLDFLVSNLTGYTAVIEQDMQSVPEFSPIMLLSLLTTGMLVAVILARRQGHLRSRSQR